MENNKVLIYDGSFNGFLSAVYAAFNEHLSVADIRKEPGQQKSLFAEPVTVQTSLNVAKRVWQGIDRRHYQAAKMIYFAFLSEGKGIEILLYRYIRSLFAGEKASVAQDYNATLNKIALMADLVAREKKHIERVLAFQKNGGQLAIASISPEYNVLPLISRYFRSLYPHHPWLIYDNKRNYGLYYHEHSMEFLHLSPEEAGRLAVQAGQLIFPGSGLKQQTDAAIPSMGVRQLHHLTSSGSTREKKAV